MVLGIVIGWEVASRLTGMISPWRSLWRWMRGHPVKATTVIVAIVLITGQIVFGWFVHKKTSNEVMPCMPWQESNERRS